MSGAFKFQNINIKVDVYGGADIKIVIEEMVKCATHLRMDVWADLNGIHTLARPDDNPDELHGIWNHVLLSKSAYRYASTGGFSAQRVQPKEAKP